MIEICNSVQMMHNVSHILSVEEAVLDKIKAFKPIIFNEVASLCGLEWSSISFHLRSPKCDSTANKKPTTSFFFDGASQDFNKIEADLLETLHRCKAPMRLELL